MSEEVSEFIEAAQPQLNKEFGLEWREAADVLEDQLDALVDLAYVLFGTVYMMGLSAVFEEAFLRVHEANMKKVRAQTIDESTRRSTYDVVKPEGWQPPVLSDLIGVGMR